MWRWIKTKLAKRKSKKYKSILILLALVICCIVFFAGIIDYQNRIVPKGIVIHHSAIPFQIDNPDDVAIIAGLHRKRGFSIFCGGNFYNIGYHYIILPNGTVVGGRPENCRGAHAIGYNDFIGICLIGDFSKSDNPDSTKGQQIPTTDQLKSLALLTKDIQFRYKISSDNIITHKSVESKTECPGENFSLENFKASLNKE